MFALSSLTLLLTLAVQSQVNLFTTASPIALSTGGTNALGHSQLDALTRRESGIVRNDTGSCAEDAWRCSGQTLERCANAQWLTIAVCSNQGGSCSAESGAIGCTGSGSGSASAQISSNDNTQTEIPVTDSGVNTADSSSQVKGGAGGRKGTGNKAAKPVGGGRWKADGQAGSDSSSVADGVPIGSSLHADAAGIDGSGNATQSGAGASTVGATPDGVGAGGGAAVSAGAGGSGTSGTVEGAGPSMNGTADTVSGPKGNGDANGTTTGGGAGQGAGGHGSIRGSSGVSGASNATTASGSGSGGGSYNAPHYVIYTDLTQNPWPTPSVLQGYNRLILAFWTVAEGPFDNARVWMNFSPAQRQEYISQYHAAGMALMVSAFGETDQPTTQGLDPVKTAQDLAKYVKDYGLDGVDVDWEDLDAMNTGKGEAWLIAFQTALRAALPRPYIITHAPLAPWFSDAKFPKGGYKAVNAAVGGGIDWYNIQFYNQMAEYTTCDTLINQASAWPGSSLLEINSKAGVPMEKIVLGKPLTPEKAGSGYMEPGMINQCIQPALQAGWNGGLMFWELLPPAVQVMATARGSW